MIVVPRPIYPIQAAYYGRFLHFKTHFEYTPPQQPLPHHHTLTTVLTLYIEHKNYYPRVRPNDQNKISQILYNCNNCE
jgi:hypothetical protein